MIEHNLPIPPRAKFGGRKPKYQLGDLNVGDSVFVPQMRPSTGYWCQKLNAKYTTRSVEQGGVKGTRVWRTA
jgi:hypothetical protein